ncbi:MAG: amidohydrolase [Nitrospinota bacterium]
MEPEKAKAIDWIEGQRDHLISVSQKIWEYAELGLEEFQSAALLVQVLRDAGFQVQEGVSGMPTAFVATWGAGEPAVGVLAEYDALPNCSVDAKANGHGCGHNLYGTGSVGAAIAVKVVMEETGIHGTVKVFGTPAEETLIGKVYMARDGVFNGIDMIMMWHPHSENFADALSSMAAQSMIFEFFGKSAHAAVNPFDGRSALDAVEIMNYAVNHLREHIPRGAMLHYVITHGGVFPNVVPPYARSWQYVRAADRETVKSIVNRLIRCGEGAALATETEVKVRTITGVYNTLPLESAAHIMQANLESIEPPRYTAKEKAFPKKKFGYSEPREGVSEVRLGGVGPWSNDLGNVSWLVPFSRCSIACHAPETPGHHPSATEQYRMGIGEKGMLYAAKVLAATSLDYLMQPDCVRRVREEWEEKTRGFVYDTIVPKGQKPPKVSGVASDG